MSGVVPCMVQLITAVWLSDEAECLECFVCHDTLKRRRPSLLNSRKDRRILVHVVPVNIRCRLTRTFMEIVDKKAKICICETCQQERLITCPHCSGVTFCPDPAVLDAIKENDLFPCCLRARITLCDGCAGTTQNGLFLRKNVVSVQSAASEGLSVCSFNFCSGCAQSKCARCWNCQSLFVVLDVHQRQLSRYPDMRLFCPHCDACHSRCTGCSNLVAHLDFRLCLSTNTATPCPAYSLHYPGGMVITDMTLCTSDTALPKLCLGSLQERALLTIARNSSLLEKSLHQLSNHLRHQIGQLSSQMQNHQNVLDSRDSGKTPQK